MPDYMHNNTFQLMQGFGTPGLVIETSYPKLAKCSDSVCEIIFMKASPKQFCESCRERRKKASWKRKVKKQRETRQKTV